MIILELIIKTMYTINKTKKKTGKPKSLLVPRVEQLVHHDQNS